MTKLAQASPSAGLISAADSLPGPAAVLALKGISKSFGKLQALQDVSFEVRPGEVHCLLGENGAGKSTLCNIIFGVHQPDTGSLYLNDEPFVPQGPAHALTSGIAMVHQHFSLVGNMSAIENMMLGRSGVRLAPAKMRERVQELCATYKLNVDLTSPVENLSVGERQRIEVLKCLLDAPKLLVLDEPTAVLPPREVGALLAICRQVAERGCGVVLVTHKLAEIAQVSHRTSVIRRGRVVETVDMKGADMSALVRSMVGREVKPLDEAKGETLVASGSKVPAVEVRDLVVKDGMGATRLELSLKVNPGEIVGLAGVEGNGQSQLGAVLAGLLDPTSGDVFVGGAKVTGESPRQLTQRGVGIVPEDRHAVGCHLKLSIAENMFLAELPKFSRFGLLRRDRLNKAAQVRMAAYDVRATGPTAAMSSLSGGNQQKVVLARELSLPSLSFLLAAQPTRGLDVGAVEAVYSEIRKARDRGVGVLLVSSELEELIAVADRVLVIYRGRIVGDLPAAREHLQTIGALMSGQSSQAAA